MKKLILILILIAFTAPLVVSCTPEKQVDQDEFQTDPNENCPPNDTNCDGVPDDDQ